MKQSNLARIFKALSSEQRLELFLLIYKGCLQQSKGEKSSEAEDGQHGKVCCGAMERAFTTACGCLNISRSTISHHFKELQDAGLIKATRKGQYFACEVNQEAVEAIKSFLE